MPPIDQDDGVSITLLGTFCVQVAGRVVEEADWPSRRSLELVQLLALAERRQLQRDQVLEALWPHLDPQAGAANLRKAAHHARQALGDPGAVVLRGGAVTLFPDRSVPTDLDRFERLAARALAAGTPDAIEEAASVGEGELLPGSPYEEWTQQPRQRTRSLQLQIAIAGGDWERVVELEPTHEPAYQHLMADAIDAGARSAALRWYERLRSVLASELGVGPDDATEALRSRCLEGVGVPVADLFGREHELLAAAAVLGEHGTGPGALVLRGGAGIGKSALCREVARTAEAGGRAVWAVTAAGADRVYGSVVDLVEAVLADAGHDVLDGLAGNGRAVLATLTDAAAPAPALEGPLSRHQVVGAVHGLLRAAARGRPIVVVCDDVHLADDATVDVLGHLASSARDVVVVLAQRDEPSPDALARTLDRLSRADRLGTVELGPLAADDVEALARARMGGSVDATVVADVARRSEGNPFVVTELARSAGAGGADGPVPAVADAVIARMVDLDEQSTAALERAAVVGVELDTGSALALLGDDDRTALDALDRALAAGVLVVSGNRYRFRHELVREALATRMPPHRRLALHRDAAERLAAAGAPAATVGAQWTAGQRPDAAAPWLIAAAEDAVRLGGFGDARRHLAPVLEHDPGHPRALRLDAEALDMMGDPAALAAYDRAIAAADDVEAGDLRAMRALAQIKQGDPAGALIAVADADPTSVIGRLSEALTYAGAAALGFADPAIGTAKAAESRRLALESGDTAAIVIASWAQAAAAHARGELHESVFEDLRETSQVPHLAVRVFDGHLCMTQRFLYGARPYEEVIAFADSIADEGARLGAARGHAFGVTLRGEAEFLSGQLDAAEADLVEGGRLHRIIGGTTGEALSLQRLAEVAMHRGRRGRAEALIAEALDLARATDIGFHLLDRIYGTRITLAGDPEQSLAMVEEAEHAVQGQLETCPGCRVTFAVPAAIASANAGDLDRATAYQESAEWLAHIVMRLPAWDAAYEEVCGHVAAADGDRSAAHRHFVSAAEGFAAAGQPIDRDRCRSLAAVG